MPIDIHYVTMAFPYPGEPFAASDVRALLREGAHVSVHALRPRHPQTDDLVAQHELQGARLRHNGAGASLRGVAHGLRHPRRLLHAATLVRRAGTSPREAVKTAALLPRCLDILADIEAQAPDVVHLFWGHYPALVGALVQRFLPGIPVSVFLGAYDLERRYPETAPVARRADAVWTHAHANVPELEALGVPADRIHVAYRGIDLTAVPEPGPKVAGRVVTAGRLIPSKGVDRVLDAFAEVLRHHPAATLDILGDGPERAALGARARQLGLEPRVRFLGHRPHAEVMRALNEAEVFLFLSHKPSERLPNVVKEAMACGCACVSSPTPGMDELVRGPDEGVVLHAAEAAAAEAVTRLLAEPERRAAMGRAARERIARDFDGGATMRRYLATWGTLAGRPRSATLPRSSTPEATPTP